MPLLPSTSPCIFHFHILSFLGLSPHSERVEVALPIAAAYDSSVTAVARIPFIYLAEFFILINLIKKAFLFLI